MMLPAPARDYLINALDHTPATLCASLSPLQTGDALWETRPNPERFRLREIVAHLADWETVWKERFERTLAEERPLLVRPDLDQRSREQGYAAADPQVCLARFQERRAAFTNWLRSLPEDAWVREAHLDRIGDLPLIGLVALALGHDSYHIRQVAEWIGSAPSRSPHR